ncbi:MAG: hypothetical protein U0271_15355 [Polyangiaceae bacterium]
MAATLCGVSEARADEFVPLLVGRFAGGPSFHLGDRYGMTGGGEITLGAAIFQSGRSNGLTNTWGLFINPELGWTTQTYGGDPLEVNMFNLAFGVGFGHPYFAVDLRPRFLIGSGDEGFVIGARNSIGVHFFLDMFTIEAGHQFVSYGGDLLHSIELYGGINFGTIYALTSGEIALQ